MPPPLVYIGYDGYVAAHRILHIAPGTSEAASRLVRLGKQEKIVFDLSGGKPIRAILFMDDGKIILSQFTPKALKKSLTATGARRKGG